jgi:hypothetical protein
VLLSVDCRKSASLDQKYSAVSTGVKYLDRQKYELHYDEMQIEFDQIFAVRCLLQTTSMTPTTSAPRMEASV